MKNIELIELEYIGIIIFIFLVSILIFLYLKQTKKKPLKKEETYYFINKDKISRDEYLKLVPFYNEQILIHNLFEVFRNIQYAWTGFDYDQIKKFTAEDTCLDFFATLESYKKKGYQHVIKDFDLVDAKINYIKQKGNIEEVSMYFSVTSYNYLIGINTSQIIQGDPEYKKSIDYLVTFIRDLKIKAKPAIHCETCGKNISDIKNYLCPYCSSMIMPLDYNFKLIKKEVIKEREIK